MVNVSDRTKCVHLIDLNPDTIKDCVYYPVVVDLDRCDGLKIDVILLMIHLVEYMSKQNILM